MEYEFEKKFPTSPKEYKLYEVVGEGVSATVHRALCVPLNIIVAIKVLDLEKCSNDLDGIRREVQTMSLIRHPNVLRAYCSFTNDHYLWVVMPYMAGGSALHIMKASFPEGFDEPVIATLLREVLKALVYLHSHGHIHRDVKAGNILLDNRGNVKLADFGVSACMFDSGDRRRARNTFVGTPCWMAPEVMQQLHGYDFKADIWSFGITALELAHGHAPFSKYPPMKVLLMTLQNAPPGLDYERDKRFSKDFKELVARCLVKDPSKRPSAEKLLKHPFFKHARSNEYIARNILDALLPLGDRFKELKRKEANLLINNKDLFEDKEQLSQKEYIRGISGWNFNLDNLKAQAALLDCSNDVALGDRHELVDISNGVQQESFGENIVYDVPGTLTENGLQEINDLGDDFSSVFPSQPLRALKSCFDVCDDEACANSLSSEGQSSSGSLFPLQQSPREKVVKCAVENINPRSNSISADMSITGHRKILSGSLIPEHVLSPCRNIIIGTERDSFQPKDQSGRNFSGPLLFHQMKDSHKGASVPALQDLTEEQGVQRKGRFKVTSASTASKEPVVNNKPNPQTGVSTKPATITAAALLPTLQFLLQQNALQKELLNSLIAIIQHTSGFSAEASDGGCGGPSQPSREEELQAYITNMQQSISKLAEDVQHMKDKNARLEEQITGLSQNAVRLQKRKETRV